MEAYKNNDDLLYSLPDYITGKLNDEGIKRSIEDEISRNAGFREEYELMKETYSSIKDLQFSEPPAHYFTNLVPNIQNRIEKSRKPVYEGIFRLANLFKYALPAVSVIVLIFIFTYSNKSNKNENMFVHTDDTISDLMKTNKDTIKTPVNISENTAVENEESAEYTTLSTPRKVKKESSTVRTEKEVTDNQSNLNIEALFTETETADLYDDYVYETDFNKLSGKEQADLINKLSITKF